MEVWQRKKGAGKNEYIVAGCEDQPSGFFFLFVFRLLPQNQDRITPWSLKTHYSVQRM